MTGPEQLRALADKATPGPWRVKEIQHHWNDYSYALDGVVTDIPDDMRLAALAPELARLVADLADALAEVIKESEPTGHRRAEPSPSDCLWCDAHRLLARVSRVAQNQGGEADE